MSGTPVVPTRRMSIGGGNRGLGGLNSPSGALQRRLSVGNSKSVSQSAMLVAAMSGIENDEATKAFEGIGKIAPVKSEIEILRLQVKAFFAYSLFGAIYDWVLLFLSGASCLLFIFETYNISSHPVIEQSLSVIELLLASVFSVDFAISLFTSDHRLEYLRSFYSLVDILTVIPTYATLNASRPIFTDIETPSGVVMYIMFGLKTTRILRPLRIRRKIQSISEEVQRTLADLILRVVVMILFNAGVMQYVEFHQQHLDFHEWMYYLWISTSTVGYGDINAVTTLGRICIMSMIGFAIAVIPMMTNELLAKMSESSPYSRAVYYPKPQSRHLIVCGDLTSTSLTELFEEIFHEDHVNNNLYVVILHTGAMAPEVERLLRESTHAHLIVYLEGTALFDRDLYRASAETAVGILIFTNKFSNTPDREDSKSIMQHYSAKRYIEEARGFEYVNQNVMFCVQLIRPENRKHFDTHDASAECATEHIICLNEIKMGIIAKSVFFPGTAALLMNMFTSFADNEEDSLGELNEEVENFLEKSADVTVSTGNRKKIRRSSTSISVPHAIPSMLLKAEPLAAGKVEDWVFEYQHGCGWELYTTDISVAFEGVVFKDFAAVLYEKLGIVLIGLQIEDLRTNADADTDDEGGNEVYGENHIRTVLNPADYKFPNMDKYKLRGLVIAENQSSANLSVVMATKSFAVSVLESVSGKYQSGVSPGGSSRSRSRSRRSSRRKISIDSQFGASKTSKGSFGDVSSFIETWSAKDAKIVPQVSMGKPRKCSVDSPSLYSYGESYGSRTSGAGNAVDDDDDDLLFHDISFQKQKVVRREKINSKIEKIKRNGQSLQEKLENIEEAFLSENYYLRTREPGDVTDQESVTIHTSVIEEIPHIHSHIIITGNGLNNIFDLIKPLRVKDLGPMKYIVILYPTEIPHAVWQRIRIFDGILLVKGTPLEEADITRAGVYRAQQVVILAGTICADEEIDTKIEGGVLDNGVAGLDALLDSDTIFTFKAVKKMNDSVQCVAEFVMDNNINYLSIDAQNLDNAKTTDYKSTPNFAAGELLASSMLDTVVCQSFYNPHIVNIINRLISSKSDDLMYLVTQNASAPKKGLAAVQCSSLYQLDLPVGMQRRAYGYLFKKLANQGILPLGLYRGVNMSRRDYKGNKLPYVFTNPPGDTELFAGDKVFVLSTIPIRNVIHQSEQQVEMDTMMEDEMDKVLHNPKRASKEHAHSLNAQKWNLLLSEWQIQLNTDIPDAYRFLAAEVGSVVDRCRKRIAVVRLNEPLIQGSPSDTDDSCSDSDSESDSNSDVESIARRENISRGTVILTAGDEQLIRVVAGNDGFFDAADEPRYMREATKRVKLELNSGTRQTKYVVDNFLPGISSITTAFEQKKFSIMKLQCERYGLRAHTAGFYTIGCWFMTLADVVECSIKVGREVGFSPDIARSHTFSKSWHVGSVDDVVSSMYMGKKEDSKSFLVKSAKSSGSIKSPPSTDPNEVSQFDFTGFDSFDQLNGPGLTNEEKQQPPPNMVRTKFVGAAVPVPVTGVATTVHLSEDILETIGDMLINLELAVWDVSVEEFY